MPRPSVTELMTKTSKALCSDSTSGRKPRSITCFSRCRSRICRSRALTELALAGDHEPGIRNLTDDDARRRRSGAAVPCAARARPRSRRSAHAAAARAPRAACAGGAASTRSRSIPSLTTTVRAAGTPSVISIERMASETQMKQSTCRYFQRDRELLLQVEVDPARRDERGLCELRCSSRAPAPPSRRRGDRGRGRCPA